MAMTRRRLAVVVTAVVVTTGACGQPTGVAGPAGGGTGLRASTSSAPATPAVRTATPAATGEASSSSGPVVRVTRIRSPITVEGDIHLDPPSRTAVPVVTATTAWTTARRSYGDPRGTVTTRVALASVSDLGTGTIRPDGAIVHDVVHRLAWLVLDDGSTCAAAGPARAPGSPPRAPVVSHTCRTITVIDALTGRAVESIVDSRPAEARIAPG